MEQQLQKYYEERFTTFATRGWTDFLEDVAEMLEAYNRIDSVNTFEDFHRRKGQVDILQWIISLKDVSEQTYDDLVLEAKNEATI